MTLQPGREASVELIVNEDDTAIALGSGDVRVLATPRVLALAEQAAMAAVAADLAEGSTSVGSWVELEHLQPTRVGERVTATAKLTAVEGSRLSFDVTVRDDDKEVARARHRRVVVARSRFE